MSSSLSGRRISSFDVGPLIGAGGMGEVYRGRDAKLNRDVAIKVLLPAVASDAERLARFNREAQVLASLNHPNIAQIHGITDSDAGPLLILEYVDGPTLADRIEKGPLPIDEAIAIAKQIADALEAAHERGIIHRDLKPANIKVDDHGNVKVLDFGLAKAIDPDVNTSSPQHLADSPTITSPAMTQAGLILGTAAYMSPEQAKGRAVDKRSDVWAFGCVLYEMLTGTRVFGGEDVTDTIAAVLRGEPDWTKVPSSTPSQIRLLLKRSLEKDRKARISDIGVARFLLSETVEPGGTTAATTPRSARAVFAVAGAVIGAAIVAAGWALMPRADAEPKQVRFEYTPSRPQQLLTQGLDHDMVIAADGSFVVYRSGTGNVGMPRLMVRAINDTTARELVGTENARYPFISPDDRTIGFFVGNELRRVPAAGGNPVTICRVGAAPRGASWGDDDSIVFAVADSNELRRVAAAGGEPAVLRIENQDASGIVAQPYVLPGSKTILFATININSATRGNIEALDVATGARKTILTAATDPTYLQSGYLIFARTNVESLQQGAALRAVRFDASRLETTGDPMTLVEGVAIGSTGAANYALSPTGHLTYVPAGAGQGSTDRTLVWVDRSGNETPLAAPPRAYATARISPDGSRIALDMRGLSNGIWIWHVARQTLSPVGRNPGQDMSPVWMPDGRRVVWASTRSGGNPNLYMQSADGAGSPERLTNDPRNQFPSTVSPDGRTIGFFGAGGTSMDAYVVNLDEPGRPAKPLVHVPSAFEFGPEISPDGKWIAYHSNDSGEFQVYVRPYPNVDEGVVQISPRGGSRPAWARSGRELFYLDSEGLLTAVPVEPKGSEFSSGTPTRLLKTKYLLGATVLGLDLRAYDVGPDGQRFLMIKEMDDPGSSRLASMIVALNWSQEVKQRLPTP